MMTTVVMEVMNQNPAKLILAVGSILSVTELDGVFQRLVYCILTLEYSSCREKPVLPRDVSIS